jgi:hypothetical protein
MRFILSFLSIAALSGCAANTSFCWAVRVSSPFSQVQRVPTRVVIRKPLKSVMVRIRCSIVTAMRADCWLIFYPAQLLGMG